MIVAAPVFGARIAPSFLHSDRMAMARLVGTDAVPLGYLSIADLTEEERIKKLESARVKMLICGGIEHELAEELEDRGIQVICNVVGEIEHVFSNAAHGRLSPGFGIIRPYPELKDAPDSPAPVAAPVVPIFEGDQTPDNAEGSAPNCFQCKLRPCLQDGTCHRPNEFEAGLPPQIPLLPMMETALDVAAEQERVLCRLAELVYFGLGMKYERIGLAFCVDLFAEAEIVARVLERFFKVTAVCCRIGDSPQAHDEADGGDSKAACNPFPMARALNRAKTDLNVALGLSMGCDVVFAQLSLAPTTTLFVKDRLLANNPIAAVHSKRVLEQVFGAGA